MSFLEKYKKSVVLVASMAAPVMLFAGGPPPENSLNNPLALTLLMIAIGLLIAIGGLAYVVMSAAQFFVQQHKEKKAEVASAATKVLPVIALCLLSLGVHAESVEPGAVAKNTTVIEGLSDMAFYTLISVIALELLVMMVLLFNLKTLLKREKSVVVEEVAVEKEPAWKVWWSKMNSFRSMKEEADIQLDHNYDGIQELDNRLPPWWLYGFYITILVAVVYLWRFHVSHSAPLSQEEYAIEMEKAEEAKTAYLAKAANNVDENTVKLLTDGASLDGGKKIFTSVCAACHGADGGGGVGPNLTDDYWLHGGGVKDVFKTIKYGWPEKGMKSWKDDFSPSQIAELTSYVKSLHGTHPATPKEPQGELYNEASPAGEVAKDSVLVTLK